MTRHSTWAILVAALVQLFSLRAAYAQPAVAETPVATTASQTDALAPAPNALSAPADATTTSKPPQRVWYGGPMLGLDALAVGLAGVSLASSSPVTLLGSGLLYTLSGPIIHGTHHEGGKAIGSLGLRLGLPVVGVLIGGYAGYSATHGCTSEMCGLNGLATGAAVGLGVGMIAASAIDITLLAYEAAPDSTGPRIALVPAIDPSKRSGSLTLQGTW